MHAHIVLIGVDYRRAPVDVREELSFTREQTLEILPELIKAEGVQEALLLGTCNRTEFYLAHFGESPVAPVLGTLRNARSRARALHHRCLRFIESDQRAAEHLFRVAAGIDSQILGDTHIVAQIKQAHRIAAEARTLGPFLDRMVTESLRAAKRARRETQIGKGAASVGSAVLRSVRHAFGDLDHVHALVLGGGRAGRDIAYHLSKVHLAGLTFVARNCEQAASMAQEFKGRAAAWDRVPVELNSADVVVAATSARLAILSQESVQRVTAARQRQLLIVDAGIPRNADPAVSELPNVHLLNLDSLRLEQEEALARRRREIPRVEAILGEELRRWQRWWTNRSGSVEGEQSAASAMALSVQPAMSATAFEP